MRAVRIEAHGGVEQLQMAKLEPPEIGPDQALVRIKTIGLNHLDLWVRKGVPGHEFPLPLVPGSDGAGVVQQVGKSVKNVAVGDEVIVLPGVSCGHCEQCLSGDDMLCRGYQILGEARDGTCAELIAVPSTNLALKPTQLPFVEAGCFALTFQTAHHMLLRRARLRPGETVMIHAAGSGVGSAGLQLAKLCGARVIALAGGEAKCKRARELGADLVIDTKAGAFVPKVKEATEKRGVDVVFEHVGAATFNDSVACLRKGGRLVTCGATSGAKVEIHLAQLFFKSLSYLGSTMGSKGDLHRLIRMAGEGLLRPIVSKVLPLEEIGEAHRLLEEREVFGKVVLEP